MILTIDKSGRMVIPQPLRERHGFTPDVEIEAIDSPEGLLLRPKRPTPSMVCIDGLWVHQGVPLPGADLTRIVEDVREERIASLIKL